MAWHNVDTLGFDWEETDSEDEMLDIKQEGILECEAEILADLELGIQPEYDESNGSATEVESGFVEAEPVAAEVRVEPATEVRGCQLADVTEWPVTDAAMTNPDVFNNLYDEIGFPESIQNSEQNAIDEAIQRSIDDFRCGTDRTALGMPLNNKHL